MRSSLFRQCAACAALFAFCFVAPATFAQAGYQVVRAFGSPSAGTFANPISATIDGGGNLFVADYALHHVQKIAGGAVVAQFGGYGTAPGRLRYPRGVATDGAGNVFVADQGNQRIDKFDNNGVFLLQFGAYGTGPGQFRDPAGVAVDPLGNVYVADATNNRVQIFDNNGVYLGRFGGVGVGIGSFRAPVSVAVDAAGNLFVSDSNNYRVQKFGSDGHYIAQFGTYGQGAGQFGVVAGLATDASGNVFVADPDNNRIEKFDNNGVFLGGLGAGYNGVAGAVGSVGTRLGQFHAPQGVALDGQGNVWVMDTGNAREQQFAPASASVSGVLTFIAIVGNASAQQVTFTFRSTDGSADIVQALTVPAGGAWTLPYLFSKAGVLHIKPDKYLAVNLALNLSGGSLSGQNAAFRPGDANNDNFCDTGDFGALVGAYGSDASVAGSGYDPAADFNGDGLVDTTDFGLLVGSYGQQGDL